MKIKKHTPVINQPDTPDEIQEAMLTMARAEEKFVEAHLESVRLFYSTFGTILIKESLVSCGMYVSKSGTLTHLSGAEA